MALKILVTGAATIAMLGCSDGASESPASPPSYSGTLPLGAGNVPVDTVGVPGQNPANSTPSSDGTEVEELSAAEQSSREGQSPDGISLVNSEEAESSASNGEQASGEMAEGNTEGPATEEPAPAEEEAVEETAEEEGPTPIVRPPLNCGAPPAPLEGAGLQACDVNDGSTVNEQSSFLWYSGGSGCMTTYDNLSGAFSAEWNNPGDFLARIGFWFDETQTFEELGELGADMSFTKQGSAGGFSFIGIYGWSTNPLVEYYIVEDSYGNGPAQPFNTQLRGNFAVDGAQYNVYSGTRNNQPSIVGDSTNFEQFFSVRQNPRQCGHVSISEHFRQWQSMGMNLGAMYESKILVEAGGGNGSIVFDHANVTLTPPNN